jgi:hypothetical protein
MAGLSFVLDGIECPGKPLQWPQIARRSKFGLRLVLVLVDGLVERLSGVFEGRKNAKQSPVLRPLWYMTK